MRELHRRHGRVIVPSRVGGGRIRSNGWYDVRCWEAWKELVRMQGLHGPGRAGGARVARREYKQVIRSAKASFRQEQADAMTATLYARPREFWRAYQPRAPGQRSRSRRGRAILGLCSPLIGRVYIMGVAWRSTAHTTRHSSLRRPLGARLWLKRSTPRSLKLR